MVPVFRRAATQPSDGFPTLHTMATVNSMTQPTPATVLVVEDDPDLRATIVESLEASGFAAAQTADAGDAYSLDFLLEKKLGNSGVVTFESEWATYDGLGGYPSPIGIGYEKTDGFYVLGAYLFLG